ncbi:hypothetical protein Sgleb_04570 [Streptomyces glebosus]|uniref:Uncharacterized protein n=1 Tax=Streptomyces glebosus TaxID=249580 RepID=A0A640SN36_9ACTN|nr:hypothetical protein [Streptomyces glebosus]GFE12410.1 hypothetical protein Sgleb_04570 [Streptomyces glebosus]GHG82881.1 hypothetical protein GCM10010513_62100 [Streptomyces glebosus]
MDHTPRGGLDCNQWIDQFQQRAEPALRNDLAAEDDQGSLQNFALDHRDDGIWVIATFSMKSHPAVTYVWSQRVMPDLSAEWDPEFASMLFGTHLIEWFLTEARKRPPSADGIIRNE